MQENEKIKFYQWYEPGIDKMFGLTKVGQHVFSYLLKNCDEDNNVSFDAWSRQQISEQHGCVPQSIRNAVSEILKADLMIKTRYRRYQLNPEYVYHGHTSRRPKALVLYKELKSQE